MISLRKSPFFSLDQGNICVAQDTLFYQYNLFIFSKYTNIVYDNRKTIFEKFQLRGKRGVAPGMWNPMAISKLL